MMRPYQDPILISNHLPVRLAVIAYLPITKSRDIFPDFAAELWLSGLMTIMISWAITSRMVIFDNFGQRVWLGFSTYILLLGIVGLIVSPAPDSTVLGSMAIVISTVAAGLALQAAALDRAVVTKIIIEAISCLIIFSTALFLLGFEPSHSWTNNLSYSQSLQAFGLYFERGSMPLTGGGTSHSAVSAVALVGLIVSRRFDLFGIVAIGCSVWGLLIGDGRAVMLASSVAILLIETTRGRAFRLVSLVTPASYAIFTLGVSLLALAPFAIGVSRTGVAADLATGNNRTLLWSRAFEYLADHPLALFLGHGLFGHQTSGMLSNSRFVIGFYGSENALSMHNVSIQYLVDGGVVAIFLIVSLLFLACKRLELSRNSRMMRAGAAMLTCMIIGGVFDVWMTAYVDEGFFAFGLIAMAAVVDWRGADAIRSAPEAAGGRKRLRADRPRPAGQASR